MAQITTPFETPPDFGSAIEIADGIIWIRLPLPMALDHVNIYAIDDGDGWCIVDTGYNTSKTIEMWENLLSGPLSGKPVTKVLLTHHHPDHIGLAGWFMSRGAKLLTSRTAYLLGRMLTLDVQSEWPKETIDFYRASGMPQSMIEARLKERPYNFADVVHPIPLGFDRLVEGTTIRLGGRDWIVRMGNGHAPEHVTLWATDNSIVIAGDQVILGISPNIGVYPTEPDSDPLAEWLKACADFLPHADPTQLVLSGHKLPFRGLGQRLEQLIEHHHQALERLSDFISEPRAAVEAFDVLFGRTLKPVEFGFALVESVAHMNHLWMSGIASRQLDADSVFRFQKL
ncbi:MAG: MBL fold metallo-hydrolase [Pseudomonadota bacterium]